MVATAGRLARYFRAQRAYLHSCLPSLENTLKIAKIDEHLTTRRKARGNKLGRRLRRKHALGMAGSF